MTNNLNFLLKIPKFGVSNTLLVGPDDTCTSIGGIPVDRSCYLYYVRIFLK
jgi:hypothetical protein